MSWIKLPLLVIVCSLFLTACHSGKKMSTIKRFHREAKCEVGAAKIRLRSDTVRIIYPEIAMFDFNSAVVKPDANRSLQGLSKLLSKYQHIGFIINGYTDNVGTEQVNKSLSEKRAESVRQLFESNGISNSRMQTHGMGAAYPVATNETEEGRQANRRVELLLFER